MKYFALVMVLFVSCLAFAANPADCSTCTGTLQTAQSVYAPGDLVSIAFTYAGVPVKSGDFLVLQTLCLGTFNGVVYDTGSQFLQTDRINNSAASGGGADGVQIPADYHGSGGCTATLYDLFTISKTRYAKNLASITFTVKVQ